MIECKTTGILATNSYIIYNKDNECIVVDPGLGYKEASEEIKNKYTVKAILLTHGHFDHIDGIQYFMDVPIYIHQLEEEFLYDEDLSLYEMMFRTSPYSKGNLDVRILFDGSEFNLIGYNFKVIHTPGHTRGSVCYLYEEGMLTGDTLFHGTCGRMDFPTGNTQDMTNSLKLLVNNYDESIVCYPGHDTTTTIGQERKNNPYLR